ncbi:MAG: hypothetical protein ACLRSW_08810 [Christensenellaceae bacterium]
MAGHIRQRYEEPVRRRRHGYVDGELLSYTSDRRIFHHRKVDLITLCRVTVTKDGYIGNSVTYSQRTRASDGGRVLKNIYIKNEESKKSRATER